MTIYIEHEINGLRLFLIAKLLVIKLYGGMLHTSSSVGLSLMSQDKEVTTRFSLLVLSVFFLSLYAARSPGMAPGATTG